MTIPGRPSNQPLVLVVDDNPTSIDLLRMTLAQDYRMKVATDGQRALKIAADPESPDLVLLDVIMPGMDGFEILRRLKADPATKDIPVLMTTAANEPESEKLGFDLGCADYITKPFNPMLVQARVRTHVRERLLYKAEKELLEKTLKGSLAMLVEMLTILDPASFSMANRLGALAERLGHRMGMEDSWMLGIAAILSQIGRVTLPDPLKAKAGRRAAMTSAERELCDHVPEIGYRLIRNIPRLEEVAEVVLYSQKNVNGTGFPGEGPAGDAIPLGSRILRVAGDHLAAVSASKDPHLNLQTMMSCTGWYDLNVLMALKGLLEEGGTSSALPVQVRIEDLKSGQVLHSPIMATDGRIFVQAGVILGAGHLERIRNLARAVELQQPILVEAEP